MAQEKHLDGPIERPKILFIGDNSSFGEKVCGFLVSEGCTCTVTSTVEALGAAERDWFDAVLLDLAHSPVTARQAILAIREVCPSLAERILVITSPQQAVLEYSGFPVVSDELPLSQLWAMLQEMFSAQQPPLPPGMQTARLIFDSLRSPRVAGIRGMRSSDRQLAFQHDSTTFNLFIRRLEGTDRLSLVGQVLDVSMRAVHGLPVLLCNRTTTLAQTVTTQFGEFGLDFELLDEAGLQVRLADGSWIYLPLAKLGWTKNHTAGLDAGS